METQTEKNRGYTLEKQREKKAAQRKDQKKKSTRNEFIHTDTRGTLYILGCTEKQVEENKALLLSKWKTPVVANTRP